MVLESLFNLMDILQVKDGTLILFIKDEQYVLRLLVNRVELCGLHPRNEQQNHQVISTGGRNQYVEIDRFETEDQLKKWLNAQNRKWGIVQKGRVTIEDIVDQYACIYRRRKGYACRVQMRVRHNRRSGHKIVEVLPLPHDHKFYGPLIAPTEFDDGTLPDQSSQTTSNEHDEPHSLNSDFQQPSEVHNNEKIQVKQEVDFSALTEQVITKEKTGGCSTDIHFQNNSNLNEEQALSQPMEMLWSNILNNHSIRLFSTDNCNANYEDQLDEEDAFEVENRSTGDNNLIIDADEDEAKHLDDSIINSVVERVASRFSDYIDSKFDSIIETLKKLTKSVDDLKNSVSSITKVQQPNQNQCQTSAQSQFNLEPFGKHLADVSRLSTISRSLLRQRLSQQHRHFSLPTTSQSSNQTKTPHSKQRFQLNLHLQNSQTDSPQQYHVNNSKIDSIETTGISDNSKQHSTDLTSAIGKVPSQLNTSSTDGLMSTNLFSQDDGKSATNFNPIKFLNNPIKTARKSRHAYRQRRRELSYKFMKEVGMMLTINGCKKSIFHWRASEIFSACQTKCRELVEAGKHVMYRGIDVTEKIYRVDCSRDLVNGRRCGQMIADSLWPRGYFQRKMLLPILKGVNHRSKKRVNGVARSPVADDQFETFKVALLLLGGFLMDETDRYKWMETAREGVNQRGLDELANSKRAHYEYDGGPLFINDVDNNEYVNEIMDGASEGERINEVVILEDEDCVEMKTSKSFSELTANLEFLKDYEISAVNKV
uniref:Uncharacterized protein n=1 Tax=Meloidogyne incognita TaxID=6306 RepID=A0A914MPQ4_MELIC